VRADLDTLVIALYCAACSLFPSPAGLRRVRLVSLCGPDWTIIDFDLVAADTPERQAGLALLDRQPLHGQLVLCDKGFAGRNFEQAVHQLGALVLRPSRADQHHRAEPPIGFVRQRIESIVQTLKERVERLESCGHGQRGRRRVEPASDRGDDRSR
jgi:hypothetical protein